MRDRGSTLVLVVLTVTVLAWATMVATAALTAELRATSRAQTAADAGALAGVSGGRDHAAEAVRRNGGELTGWSHVVVGEHQRVTVTVRLDGFVAFARATDEP